MAVELTPQIEAFIQEKVRSGKYSNAADVVSESLQLLEARDRHEQLKAAVAVGDDQFKRGEFTPWTPASMSTLLKKADEDDLRGTPIADDVQP